MGECHYCFDCGRCRGEMPPAMYVHRCPQCRHRNEHGSKTCAKCGASLLLDPAKGTLKMQAGANGKEHRMAQVNQRSDTRFVAKSEFGPNELQALAREE